MLYRLGGLQAEGQSRSPGTCSLTWGCRQRRQAGMAKAGRLKMEPGGEGAPMQPCWSPRSGPRHLCSYTPQPHQAKCPLSQGVPRPVPAGAQGQGPSPGVC